MGYAFLECAKIFLQIVELVQVSVVVLGYNRSMQTINTAKDATVRRVQFQPTTVITKHNVATGIISSRVKHTVRVLVNGARTHERVFMVNKWQGHTTASERAKAEAYCVELTRELSSNPACKSFTVSEEVGKETLELTEAQMRMLEEAE